MRIEHIGYMVEKPAEVAAWYVEHLGFSIRRRMTEAPWMHFLADSDGKMMIEVYNNARATVPDYAAMDPLVLHLAFACEDPEGEAEELLSAGATLCAPLEIVASTGDKLIMLRDPWGFPIQLAKRHRPMTG